MKLIATRLGLVVEKLFGWNTRANLIKLSLQQPMPIAWWVRVEPPLLSPKLKLFQAALQS